MVNFRLGLLVILAGISADHGWAARPPGRETPADRIRPPRSQRPLTASDQGRILDQQVEALREMAEKSPEPGESNRYVNLEMAGGETLRDLELEAAQAMEKFDDVWGQTYSKRGFAEVYEELLNGTTRGFAPAEAQTLRKILKRDLFDRGFLNEVVLVKRSDGETYIGTVVVTTTGGFKLRYTFRGQR